MQVGKGSQDRSRLARTGNGEVGAATHGAHKERVPQLSVLERALHQDILGAAELIKAIGHRLIVRLDQQAHARLLTQIVLARRKAS